MPITTHIDGAFVDVHVTGTLGIEDLPNLLNAMERARQNGPFVLLTDTLAMKNAPTSAIKTFADRLKALPSMKDVWLGDAVVVGSTVVRFALSTLIMIAPLPTEVRAFDRRNEALTWCASLLDARRIPLPRSLRMTA